MGAQLFGDEGDDVGEQLDFWASDFRLQRVRIWHRTSGKTYSRCESDRCECGMWLHEFILVNNSTSLLLVKRFLSNLTFRLE